MVGKSPTPYSYGVLDQIMFLSFVHSPAIQGLRVKRETSPVALRTVSFHLSVRSSETPLFHVRPIDKPVGHVKHTREKTPKVRLHTRIRAMRKKNVRWRFTGSNKTGSRYIP